jgi:hypothetical protein
MRTTTRTRVEQLRRLLEQDGPCPWCPRLVLVFAADQEPEPCPACGREPDAVTVVEEVVDAPED